MCEYEDFVFGEDYDRGYINGFIRGYERACAECLQALMKNTGQGMDEAMRLLDLDPEDKPHLQQLLQELHSS